VSGFTVRPAAADELPAILALRHEVFCVEQGVPEELDRDGCDRGALHLVAGAGRRVIGTCRLVGTDRQETWRLGRMAVARDWRGRGVGGAILVEAHRQAALRGVRRMVLAAQLPARDFYSRHGYEPFGEEFEEAGIPHVAMTVVLAGGGR
jgi:predicted GNAT family N-acyltransferase